MKPRAMILEWARNTTKRSGRAFAIFFGGPIAAIQLMAGSMPSDAPLTMPSAGWHLAWSDAFNQPDGSAPDPTKWSYETGGNGWGNNEMEYYTVPTNNACVTNGKLIIEARQENIGNKKYTSARLHTKGKEAWTYGWFEARIKIPRGQGIWPAFWMLGTNISSAGWPSCGEIDIMENIGKEPGTVHGTIHGPGYSGEHGIGGPVTLPGNAVVADDFHIFAVDWEPKSITWFMDGRPYFKVTPDSLPKNTRWAFDQPKYILLNLAVGGGWPGNPDSTSIYPQQMVVEYVRVYQKAPEPVPESVRVQ